MSDGREVGPGAILRQFSRNLLETPSEMLAQKATIKTIDNGLLITSNSPIRRLLQT
jgi:hypothetical protein